MSTPRIKLLEMSSREQLAMAARGATGLLVIATACALLGGAGWVFELSSHFKLQYLIVALALALLLAASRSWRWLPAALACLAVNALAIVPWHVPSAAAALDHPSATLRIYCANVLRRNHEHGPLIDEVRRTRPDVVVLVEVTPRWMQGLEPLRASHPHVFAEPRNDPFGIALFSRHPFRHERILRVGEDGVPVLQADVVVEGAPVTVVGVHAMPPVHPELSQERDLQLEELAEHLSDHQLPVVLAGDLNLSLFSPSYERFERLSGLTNARRGPDPAGVLPTWPSSLPAALRIPIDHCMVSGDVAVRDCRVGPSIESDHLPLIVDLEVPLPERSRGVSIQLR